MASGAYLSILCTFMNLSALMKASMPPLEGFNTTLGRKNICHTKSTSDLYNYWVNKLCNRLVAYMCTLGNYHTIKVYRGIRNLFYADSPKGSRFVMLAVMLRQSLYTSLRWKNSFFFIIRLFSFRGSTTGGSRECPNRKAADANTFVTLGFTLGS